jgi:hypothetical protein
MGSARVSRAGERVLAIANFRYKFALFGAHQIKRKDCFGVTPKPARETHALPINCSQALISGH